MATSSAPIPFAPSPTERPIDPRYTRWRGQMANRFDYDVDPESDVVKLLPSEYTLPQLMPSPSSVDTSNRPQEILIALQRWEGVVLDVDDACFVVRLIDVPGEHDDEEVKLSREELSDFDVELLEPGAILYWTIGYRQQLRGSRERVSRIRLRRVPAWTERQLTEAQQSAADLAHELGW
jgi:hypothetical protein